MEIEEEEDKFIKENPIIFKKYKVKKKLGEGAFGDVYLGQAISNNAYVAIKTEPRKIIKPILESEAFLLYSIAGPGIPEVKSFGKTKHYNILIEPLLGKSLFDIFAENHKSMNLIDACLIGKQVIDRIQWVHSKYIVHRDIKPDNFLIGRNDPHVLYLIDFGLSKKYRSSTTGKHIRFGFTGKLTGTVRFASANALRGGEQSRRDDIESIGYMMVYFLKKKLPWQGVTGHKKMERYLKIYQMKKNTTPEKLCEGLFPEMVEYVKYARGLEFEQEPDYKLLKNLFNKMLKRVYNSNDQLVFSWIKAKDLKALKNPINPATRKDSPQSRIYKKIKKNLEGRSLSSDSDSKTGSYAQVISSANNLNVVGNNKMIVSSEDQLETKEKKIINKSIKSKEGLNTTIANLELSFDDNIVDFENEKINASRDNLGESNKNTNEINRNLNNEFNNKIIKEENKDNNNDKNNNDIKEDNNNNKEDNIKEDKVKEDNINNNKSLVDNISDENSNNNKLESNQKEEKNKKEKEDLINSEIKKGEILNKEEGIKNNNNNPIIDLNNNNNHNIPKVSMNPEEFTFKEPLNTNRNSWTLKHKKNNYLLEKNPQKEIINENQQNIQENKKNVSQLLTGKALKVNEEMKRSNNGNQKIPIDKKKNINKNDNINNKKIIKTKILKKSLKQSQLSDNNNKKPENIIENININNITNSVKIQKPLNQNNKYKEQEFDIKQIAKEKNNNLYNDILNDDIDFIINIKDLKKRPTAGPALNTVLTLNKKNLNGKNNIINSNENRVIYNNTRRNNNINNNKNLKRKIQQKKIDNNISSNNNTNYFYENNNDLFFGNQNNSQIVNVPKKEMKTIKLKNKKIYQGIGFQTYQNLNPVERKDINNKEIIPEDNYKNSENINHKVINKTDNSNRTNKIIKNINKNPILNVNDIYPMNNKSLNNNEYNSNKMKYINNIKAKNKVSQSTNEIKKNVKIVKLTNENMNNAFFNETPRNNNINNKMFKNIQNTNIKKLNIKELGKLQIINNNNNFQNNFNYRSNNVSTPNNTLAYNNIVHNPQINYQFPVYINNNNNIYNTQYLNTAGNIPLNSNNAQINQKIITINQIPNHTNLNFVQNPGVPFTNITPNNYNIYGNVKYYQTNNFNAYQYPKKYKVSLIRK